MFGFLNPAPVTRQPYAKGGYMLVYRHDCGWIGQGGLTMIGVCPGCGALDPDFERLSARQLFYKSGPGRSRVEWEVAHVDNRQAKAERPSAVMDVSHNPMEPCKCHAINNEVANISAVETPNSNCSTTNVGLVPNPITPLICSMSSSAMPENRMLETKKLPNSTPINAGSSITMQTPGEEL